MATSKKRRKKKKKGGGAGASGTSQGGGGGGGSSGGVMQSIRSGFRRAAGVEEAKEKPSTVSNVVWTLVLLAAVGFLIYRWYG